MSIKDMITSRVERKVVVDCSKIEFSEGEDLVDFFSALFQANYTKVKLAFESDGLSLEVPTFMHAVLNASTFSKYLHSLLAHNVFTYFNTVHRIDWLTKYNNIGDPAVATTIFKVGDKLSDIPYNNIVGYNETNIVSSNYTGSVNVDTTPCFVLLLNNQLTVDKFLRFQCENPIRELEDIVWQQSVNLDNDSLRISGTVLIKTDCPINANGIIKITGCKGDLLVLDNTSKTQPCIGGRTNDNLSYGRWEVSRNHCTKIIIDGVTVICKTTANNFMLGEFGTNNVPEVVCINGGALFADEVFHKRVMSKGLEPLYGSTKHSDYPSYDLVDSNEVVDILAHVLQTVYNITDESIVERVRDLMPDSYLNSYENCHYGLQSCLPLILKDGFIP